MPKNEATRGLTLKDGRRQKFTKNNISRVPNVKGGYVLFDNNKNAIYTGRSSAHVGTKWGKDPEDRWVYGLRHRLQSYYQKDNFNEHPTKAPLRKEIAFFDYTVFNNEEDLRKWERENKKGKKFNHL